MLDYDFLSSFPQNAVLTQALHQLEECLCSSEMSAEE